MDGRNGADGKIEDKTMLNFDFVIDAINAVSEAYTQGDDFLGDSDVPFSEMELSAAKNELIAAVNNCVKLRISNADMRNPRTVINKITNYGNNVSANAQRVICEIK